MDAFFGEVWKAAQQAGPFASLLALIWGWSQWKRAEMERAERVKLQELISGEGGLLERVVKSINDSTTAMIGMNDSVRPIVTAMLDRVRSK